MTMYCDNEEALGCAGWSTVVLRNVPKMRVGPSEDDLEPTTWDLMENGCSYLHKVVMHEAGHVFGLGHPTTPQTIMYQSVSGWLDHFCEPQPYDIVGTMVKYQSR